MQLHVVFDRHLRKKSEICHREFVCLDFHRRTALDKSGNILVICFHHDEFFNFLGKGKSSSFEPVFKF